MNGNEITDFVNEFSEKTSMDFYLFTAQVNDSNADKIISAIRGKGNKKGRAALILTTNGGDPDAGYRIMRTFKRYYPKISVYIFGSCKSTGTLMTIGADEIIMGDYAELGPLDTQITKDDELSNTSVLNLIQSLTSLNKEIFRSFESNFMMLKARSGNAITTKTAAEICTKLAIGLISPISAQIEPSKLGEIQRAINVADEYGKRLWVGEDKLIAKFIVNYPSHSFVIDFEEAKELIGEKVRFVNEEEIKLEDNLFHLVRRETKNDIIFSFSKTVDVQNNPSEEPTGNIVEEHSMKLNKDILNLQPN